MPKKATIAQNKKTNMTNQHTEVHRKVTKTPNKFSASTAQQMTSPKNKPESPTNKPTIIIPDTHQKPSSKHKNSPQNSQKSKNHYTSKRSQKSHKIPLEIVRALKFNKSKDKIKNKFDDEQNHENDGTFYRTMNRNQKREDDSDLQNTLKNSSKNYKAKTKIDLSEAKANMHLKHLQQCPSYREYCVVDKCIVPVINSNQKRYITCLMGKTMSTCDIQIETKEEVKNWKKYEQIHRITRLQRSVNTSLSHICQVAINACQQSQEFGTQYSERINQQDPTQSDMFSIFKVRKNKQNDQNIQKSRIKQQEYDKQNEHHIESLDQLLLKIQFMHLPNKSSFDKLTEMQKEHYTQLLSALMEKLNPKQVNIKKVNLFSKSSDIQENPITSKDKFGVQKEQIIQKCKLYESLQLQVYLRQCKMVNAIPQAQQSYYSLIGIIQFLSSFLCFIELNYTNEFLFNMRRIYGFSYKERFVRIRRNQKKFPIQSNIVSLQQNPTTQFKPILSQQLFDQFIQENFNSAQQEDKQSVQVQAQNYRKIFYQALFDTLNTQINCYRGYYATLGEPSPWSCHIIKSITFFTIDEESIELLFSQLKQKFVEICSHLCGILVDPIENKPDLKYNPVMIKNQQKQDRIILQYLSEYDNSYEIQNCVTGTLISISQMVWEQIFAEIVVELSSIPI